MDEGKGAGGGEEEGEANATKGLVMFEPCKFIHTKEQAKTHTWKTRKKKIKNKEVKRSETEAKFIIKKR